MVGAELLTYRDSFRDRLGRLQDLRGVDAHRVTHTHWRDLRPVLARLEYSVDHVFALVPRPDRFAELCHRPSATSDQHEHDGLPATGFVQVKLLIDHIVGPFLALPAVHFFDHTQARTLRGGDLGQPLLAHRLTVTAQVDRHERDRVGKSTRQLLYEERLAAIPGSVDEEVPSSNRFRHYRTPDLSG